MSRKRAQRTYDHRLLCLLQETGDITIATRLGVPRSPTGDRGEALAIRRAPPRQEGSPIRQRFDATITVVRRRCFTLVLAGLSLLLSPLSIAAAEPAQSKTASLDASRELQALHDDDQRDQNTPEADALTREFLLRQVKRRDRVMEILRDYELSIALDFRNAALLLQHGSKSGDYLLAHALACAAIFEDDAVPFGKFLCGATLDRFLVRLGRAQCFGSQGTDPTQPDSGSNATLPLGDGIRGELGFGPGGAAKGKGAEKKAAAKKTPSAKDLPSRFKEMQKDANSSQPGDEKAAERRRARAAWALDLLKAGEFQKPEQWFQAASLAAEASAPDDLLVAHLAAVVAAVRGHASARPLAARTLDQWLVAIGEPQRFGTEPEGGAARKEPPDSSWPACLRKAHDLPPRAPEATPPGK